MTKREVNGNKCRLKDKEKEKRESERHRGEKIRLK